VTLQIKLLGEVKTWREEGVASKGEDMSHILIGCRGRKDSDRRKRHRNRGGSALGRKKRTEATRDLGRDHLRPKKAKQNSRSGR